MTETQETDCLKCNPFEGDFGSPGDKVLKDKIVTARKGGTCGMCLQEIQPCERVRTLAAIFDGAMRHYRWCEKCCEAMAASWTDNGDAWTARVALERTGPNVEVRGAEAGSSPERPSRLPGSAA